MPPQAGIDRPTSGHHRWGEECPIRITDGDGGADSARISTHCATPAGWAPFDSPDACYRDSRLTLPSVDVPMLAIFEFVKFAKQVESMLNFGGFYDVFAWYLRTRCLQTHIAGRQKPVLAVRLDAELDRFVIGAWYATTRCQLTREHEVIQVCSVRHTTEGTRACCRRVFQTWTQEGLKVSAAYMKDGVAGLLKARDASDKPLEKYIIGTEYWTTMATRCDCCAPACPEAICAAGSTFCPRKRVVGRGRVFDPSGVYAQ